MLREFTTAVTVAELVAAMSAATATPDAEIRLRPKGDGSVTVLSVSKEDRPHRVTTMRLDALRVVEAVDAR